MRATEIINTLLTEKTALNAQKARALYEAGELDTPELRRLFRSKVY
jgi:hypothetical protein